MSDNAKACGQPVRFRVALKGHFFADSTYTVKVVKNGSDFNTYTLKGKTPQVEFADTPAAIGRTYYRVTVEGRPGPYPQVPVFNQLAGNMVALSNPIYFNFDPNF
jgi:hypothetical protein